MTSYKINQKEFTSLLFYQGADIQDNDFSNDKSLKQFYSVRNAYEGLNMLLFEGVENERTRFILENRRVDTVLLDQIDELLDIYVNLYTAMCKYTCDAAPCTCMNSYRYDRQQSLESLLSGRTTSFFSTSMEKKTKEYFKEKAGLLILDITARSDTIHLVVNDVLGERSKYPEEEEILYPPYSRVEMTKMELTEEEQTYKDRDKKPPAGKYEVKISNKVENLLFISDESQRNIVKRQLLSKIKDKELLQNAKNVWEVYNAGREPVQYAIDQYMYWKRCLQTYIKIRYAEIYAGFFGWPRDTMVDQMKMLLCRINYVEKDTDEKRRKYETELLKQNRKLAVIRGAALFFIALTLIDLQFDIESLVKVLGIGLAVISLTLYRLYKGIALEGKIRQRTLTYLRLDELKRDIGLEKVFSKESMERYVERYKKIILEDDMSCINNTEQLLSLSDQLIKNSVNDITNMMK